MTSMHPHPYACLEQAFTHASAIHIYKNSCWPFNPEKLTEWTSTISMTLFKCRFITPDHNHWCVLSWVEKINKTFRLRRGLFFVLFQEEIWKPSQRIQADLCSDTGMKESGKGCWDKEIFVFPNWKGCWDVTLLSTQALLIRLNTGKSV